MDGTTAYVLASAVANKAKSESDARYEELSQKIEGIVGGIHYKGAVNYYANLPTNAKEGDAYTVKYAGSTGTVADGTEYVWGKMDGVLSWIDFSKNSYTKEETDKKIADVASGIAGKVDQSEFDELTDKVEKIIKKEAKIYGFKILKDEANPSERVVYIEDAVGMTPCGITDTDTFEYGSWKDTFFMPRPCMIKSNGTVDYYLNPNNYKEKLDGSMSDVTNLEYDGNAMMEWDKIWFKFLPTDNEIEGGFLVSNVQVDDTYHCWCNYDMNDNIIDHFYTAIYTGTGTTKLRSMSGVQLLPANGNGSTTTTQETTRALANGNGWYIETWADRMLMSSLLILMGKSTNTQTVFGAGLTAGSQTAKEQYITGTLDDKGLFYGSTSANVACKCFGMENFFGCQWNRVAGCISVDRDVKVKLTWGKADGSDTIGYNQTGVGYMSIGTMPDTNSYAKSMAFTDKGFMTSAVGGSATTYWCDYFYQNTGTRYLLVSGSSGHGVTAGAFCFDLSAAPSDASWIIGASLSFKPLG